MNRRIAWIWGLVTVGIAAVVAFVAYHAGQTTQIATTTNGDGHMFYPGYWGFGFFPFFGLFWIVLIGFLLFRAFGGRRGPWYGGGYWHQHPTEPGSGTPPVIPTVPPGPSNQPDRPTSA
jgi:hypothetical protein